MRARMAAAVVKWQALDPTAKKTWALEARRYGGRMSGYHLFLRGNSFPSIERGAPWQK